MRTDLDRETVDRVRRLAAEGRGLRDLAGEVVRLLRSTYPHHHWVGVYMVEGDRLRLWAWDGPAPTEHVEIPLHTGICGWAASTGEVANVPDVRSDPRYLACFTSTRSELVVPIRRGDVVYGEIDIDSDVPAAFTAEDEAVVGAICDVLAEVAAREGLPGRRLGG